MKFQINEYVWDRVWDSPAIVTMLEIEGGEVKYRVSEINEQRKMGRTAWREPDQLCRYVRVLLPEDEAVELVEETIGQREGVIRRKPAQFELQKSAGARIVKQLRKRGVEFDAAN